MPKNSNKAIVRCFFDEAFNQRNLDLVDVLVSPHFLNHNASIQLCGIAGVKKAWQPNLLLFPISTRPLRASSPRGIKWSCGRPTVYRPMDGQPVQLTWIEIIRLEGGKFAEAWVEADLTPMLEQLNKHLK
jgi:hypothetical protein